MTSRSQVKDKVLTFTPYSVHTKLKGQVPEWQMASGATLCCRFHGV